jgi:hypothetical protein
VENMYRFIRILPAAALVSLLAMEDQGMALAQSSATQSESTTAALLDILGRQRAQRWAGSAPSIHCAPAPLTEQPGAAAQEARPHVLPLESAFLDAASVRHLLLARGDRGAAGR